VEEEKEQSDNSTGKRRVYVCVASGVTLDSVYKSLNRTVLYLLSRPIHNVTDQMALLDALHRLTSHRSLILGPGNFDQQFIGCLCYCLMQLTADSPENIRSVFHASRTWTLPAECPENLEN